MSHPTSTTLLLFSFIALIAGALVPFQAGSNAYLGKALGHPIWATLVSLVVSLVVMLPVILAMKIPVMNVEAFSKLPWWAWFGGVAGVIYITAALTLTPQLGATMFIVCVICGQVTVSLIIDKFGLMGLPTKEITFGRVTGVALIILGMVLVQFFSNPIPDTQFKNQQAQLSE